MTDALSPPKPGTRKSARWALMPIGLLASSTLGVSWMAAVAIRDPNFALEPDYYQKALHWDQTQAQAADNQRLAYQFSAPRVIVLDKAGQASVGITIKDRDGHPVSGGRVTAEAFPNAYSDELTTLTFVEQEPGSYVASLKVAHPGLWELRVSMNADGNHATAVLRCDLLHAGAA
jgi:nitrogen fixation protein FixH